MSPAEIIGRATEDGVLLALSPSGGISAKGVQSAIDRWLPEIRQSKAAIVLLLRPGAHGWSAEDWHIFFHERAGIAEFDGGLPRPQAEASAYTWCIAEWLNRNPARSPAGSCSGDGGHEHSPDPLLVFESGGAGGVWLHPRCQPGRKAEAVAALAAMEIVSPANFADDSVKNGGT
jgi:hypothetical protein